MMIKKILRHYAIVIGLGLGYLWGVVSIQHYLPSSTDFFLSLYSASIMAVGAFIFFMSKHQFRFSFTHLLWLGFFVLLLAQPMLNQVAYPDGVILVAFGVFLCLLTSLAVATLDEQQKQQSVHGMACVILLSGIFTVISQFAQVFQSDFLGVLFFENTGRPTGNVAQVNQAAFIHTLAMSSIIYLCQQLRKKNIWILGLYAILMMLLSMGVGMTASRGGVLLCVGVFCGLLFYHTSTLKARFQTLGLLPFVVTGYLVGTKIMQDFIDADKSGISRLVGENTLYLRQSLIHQAWLGFKESPIVGVGFGEFNRIGVNYAEDVVWFTFVNHAHNIVAQIGAELGIVGLLLLGCLIGVSLKRLNFFRLPTYKAFSYSVLLLIAMYSLSEFPLWMFRFLILFTFFIAIIDDKYYQKFTLKINHNMIGVMSCIFSFIIMASSFYYIKQYYNYRNVYHMVETDMEVDDKIDLIESLPNVFGYTKYKETLLYAIYPITSDNISHQILVGDRLLSSYMQDFHLLKQANMLVLVGEHERAQKTYRALCLLDDKIHCNEVMSNLRENYELNPNSYLMHLNQFENWHNKHLNDSVQSVE